MEDTTSADSVATLPAAAGSSPCPTAGSLSLTMGDLECGVCLSLFVQPITLPCGHTFCKACAVRTLFHSGKRCPSCRAVCHISPEAHPENVVLAHIAQSSFPDLYAQRLAEAEQERQKWTEMVPIFYYNMPIFPGEVLQLHLFEPRYKLMMRRIVDSSRRFAYVPNYSNYHASVGDVALIAELVDVQFLPDGRSHLEAKIVGRYRIVDHFIEEGTGNLHYCRVQEFKDDEVSSERQSAVDEAFQKALSVATRVFMSRRDIKLMVVERYGEMPTRSPELLSLWIAAVLPLERQEKHRMLVTTDTLERLTTCNRCLANLINRPNGSTASSLSSPSSSS